MTKTIIQKEIQTLQEQYDKEYARLVKWQLEIRTKGLYYVDENNNSRAEKTRHYEAGLALEELGKKIENLKKSLENLPLILPTPPPPTQITSSINILQEIKSLQSYLATIK